MEEQTDKSRDGGWERMEKDEGADAGSSRRRRMMGERWGGVGGGAAGGFISVAGRLVPRPIMDLQSSPSASGV